MQDPSTMGYKNFKYTITESLKKHAPLKRKYLRANYSNFITKELIKAIMQRSKLCNLYLEVSRMKTELGIIQGESKYNTC